MTNPSAVTPTTPPRDVAGKQGYISSLVVRPHALPPPIQQPSAWDELRASLAWIVGSWLRPGDAAARRTQRAGREDRTP